MSNEKQSYETSALKNILNAGVIGAASPSEAAQIAASASRHTPPGTESAAAQILQAGVNMAVVGSKEFMDGTIRQHGRSPSAVLQDLKIQQAIDNKTPSSQPAANKGIEAARQKVAEKQSEKSSGESTNKGIESYRNQASGQSTVSSNSSASSQGQSSGSGQDR